MHALVNAFMRCFSFLLPPSWLCVSSCLWVGNDYEDALQRPNPRARFKSRKPLTYEEVRAAAEGGSSPSVSLGPGCVSLAATSPAAPQGPPTARIWIGALWRAVERVFGAPWVFLRHRWCPKKRRTALRIPCPARAFEPRQIRRFQAAGAETAATTPDWEGPGGAAWTQWCNMSGTVGVLGVSPGEGATDALTDLSVDEVITVDQHSQEMGTVTITVAIQAAEDEEPEEERSGNVECLRGSCSEDELGRHDKSRGTSWMMNQMGAKTDPWGTPLRTMVQAPVEGSWRRRAGSPQ
ncbi:la-related protein 6a, partial [Fundulus heteroclitus]|uniref:la-related protein 6a n=1 Tax=Fundulus heteroclitus TaxID=8078 RepID=UPI00165C4F4E